MATKRRRFTAQFKARVALEAFRGDRTIQAIAAKHQVHPNQVSVWKRQAQESCSIGLSNQVRPPQRATLQRPAAFAAFSIQSPML